MWRSCSSRSRGGAGGRDVGHQAGHPVIQVLDLADDQLALLEEPHLVDVGLEAGDRVVAGHDGAGARGSHVEHQTNLVALKVRDGPYDEVTLAQLAGLNQQCRLIVRSETRQGKCNEQRREKGFHSHSQRRIRGPVRPLGERISTPLFIAQVFYAGIWEPRDFAGSEACDPELLGRSRMASASLYPDERTGPAGDHPPSVASQSRSNHDA